MVREEDAYDIIFIILYCLDLLFCICHYMEYYQIFILYKVPQNKKMLRQHL